MRRWSRIGATIVVPVALAAALVPLRDHTPNTTIALIIALAVASLASVGSRAEATLAALSGGVGFDVFHTHPFGSLAITRSEDLQTAALLVAVGLLVGQLGTTSRHHRAGAARTALDLERLHALAEMVAAGDPVDAVVATANSDIAAVLQLRSCAFDPAFTDQPGPFVERHGAVTWGQIRWKVGSLGLPSKPISLVVEHQSRPLGRFVLCAPPGTRVTARQLMTVVALGDQAGAAIAAQGVPYRSGV